MRQHLRAVEVDDPLLVLLAGVDEETRGPGIEEALQRLYVRLGVLAHRPVLVHLLQGEHLLGFALYFPGVRLVE